MPDLTELQRLAEEGQWMPADTAKKLIAVALAAQKAVDALEEAQTYTASRSWSPSMTRECKDAEVGLRTALEELK